MPSMMENPFDVSTTLMTKELLLALMCLSVLIDIINVIKMCA